MKRLFWGDKKGLLCSECVKRSRSPKWVAFIQAPFIICTYSGLFFITPISKMLIFVGCMVLLYIPLSIFFALIPPVKNPVKEQKKFKRKRYNFDELNPEDINVNDMWEQIIQRWKFERVKRSTKPESTDIESFEKKHSVVLPAEVRAYFENLHGMEPNEIDDCMFRFWPIAEIEPLDSWQVHRSGIKD